MKAKMILGVVLGVVFAVVGVLSLIGAVELMQGGAEAGAAAQALFAPITLFVFAGAAAYVAYSAWRPRD